MSLILEDVNLHNFEISQDGRIIILRFTQLNSDKLVAEISCKSVFVLQYHNAFESEDRHDGLPCYVGYVKREELSGEVLTNKLKNMGYGFIISSDPATPNCTENKVFLPDSNNCHLLCLEGGQIDLEILCSKIEAVKNEI
ncbi:MAG: hypothetical protein JW806_00970 [Sedimentisphaerales bacterium]|nr:hypothetical protein [Sedimentisphaerales bacterium]